MLVRRLFAPSLLISTFFTLHCSDDPPRDRKDDDAGEGGEDESGGSTSAGKGGATSGGKGGGQASGGASSGAGGSSAGTTSGDCTPGQTRTCVGPGACEGGQECGSTGTWLTCDCASGSGGSNSGGSGGTSPSDGGEGGEVSSAGSSGAGGADDGGSGEGGTGASSGNGGSGGSSGSGTSGSTSSGGTSGSTSSGGTGGSTSSGGTGGSTSSGGTGGSSAGTSGTGGSAGSCAAGEGLALVPEPGEDASSGWIDRSSNCVGVQGAIYGWTDAGGSEIELTEADGRICVSGFAAEVVNDAFDVYWGSVLTIQLNNDGEGNANAYPANTYGVDGFRFNVTGSDIPAELRPRYVVTNFTEYCKQVCASGDQSILFSEAHPECWSGELTSTPSLSAVTALEFHVPSIRGSAVTFDFCIEDLAAIVNGAPVGDPGTCDQGSGGGSCQERCGDDEPVGDCWCDYACSYIGDCCSDYVDECSFALTSH